MQVFFFCIRIDCVAASIAFAAVYIVPFMVFSPWGFVPSLALPLQLLFLLGVVHRTDRRKLPTCG